MADHPQQSGTLKTVLSAIVITLVAGGTSPWWYDGMFPKTPQPRPSPTEPAAQGSEPVGPRFVMGALQYDKAFIGRDLSSSGTPASSPEDCSNLCMNDDRCHAMTYIKSQQLCWLKSSSDGGSAQTSDMISAVKQAAK